MISEKTLQESIQDTLRGMVDFDDRDVTINDWSVLDQSMVNAPYIILVSADDFETYMDTPTATGRYQIKAYLVIAMGSNTWQESYDELRDVRQNIMDTFNTVGTALTAGGLAGVNIRRIYSLSEIGYIFPPGVDPDIEQDATPDYMTQMIGFDTEIY